MTDKLPPAWEELYRAVNGRPGLFGSPGVRDPDFPCEAFDGEGYAGNGDCEADGHYLCRECSRLSSKSPMFWDRGGRRDRLLMFWRRKKER